MWGCGGRRLVLIPRRGRGPGSLHEEGCVNKCYLSAASPGLSELSRARRGAGGFNWHISYSDAAELLT